MCTTVVDVARQRPYYSLRPVVAPLRNGNGMHGAASFTTTRLNAGQERWVALKVLFYIFFSLALALLLLVLHLSNHPCSDVASDRLNCALGLEPPLVAFSSLRRLSQLQLNSKYEHEEYTHEDSDRALGQRVARLSAIFQDLMDESLLKPGHKVLCVGASAHEEVLALNENGVVDAIGIDALPSPPLVLQGNLPKQPLADGTFDFEFSTAFDDSISPDLFVGEIERTLKVGGVAAMHVSLARWREKFLSSSSTMRGDHSSHIDPVTLLFKHSEIVYVTAAYAPLALDTIIVFRRNSRDIMNKQAEEGNQRICCVSDNFNNWAANQLEPLIREEVEKPSIDEHVQNLRYVPDLWDINKHSRHVYVDVGARDLVHSIDSWFERQYPTNGHKFNMFAIEADGLFQSTHALDPEVTFLPYAAWIRNESVMLWKHFDPIEEPHYHGSATEATEKRAMVVHRKEVQGLDFADWLKKTVYEDDFVVVKMDANGMEFELMRRMLETGAICLVDELFLSCHQHVDWNHVVPVGAIYERSYAECLSLYEMLRSIGVAVHQWW